MRTSVQFLCRDCLRSVERSGDSSSDACPGCGGRLEPESSREPMPTAEPFVTFSVADNAEPDATRWSETWSRGSLGQVGRFQIRELLGDGGYGRVYLAYDPRLDRDVALKVLKEKHAGERPMGRFFREARAAARLDHPNIVPVHDAGRDGGRCWVAYQYIAGMTLSRYRDSHPPDARAATRMVLALADALDHAHRRGVSHRDLKPSNVLIDDRGRPRLTDFGLSRRLDCDSDLTLEGTVLGTPAYMSPEQAAGYSHEADARSDVFSLGLIYYELLCGRRPPELPSSTMMLVGERPAKIPPPRSVVRSIPRPLDRICRRALALDPAYRYPDARAMADDLSAWLDRGRARRRRATPALALLAGLGLGLLLHAWPADPAPPAAPVAVAAVVDNNPPPATPAAPKPDPFAGNTESRTLHHGWCRYALARDGDQLKKSWKVFPGLAEALAAGPWKSCSKCGPPLAVPPDAGVTAASHADPGK